MLGRFAGTKTGSHSAITEVFNAASALLGPCLQCYTSPHVCRIRKVFHGERRANKDGALACVSRVAADAACFEPLCLGLPGTSVIPSSIKTRHLSNVHILQRLPVHLIHAGL